MGVSDIKCDTNSGPVLDLSAKGMQKLEPSFTCSEDTHTLVLDRNQIMKLDHLERSPMLQHLSVASNRLVRMMGVSRLTELRVLNLPSNSIGYIEGLRDLPHLEWLNLSGNNIKVIEQLNNCVSLQHLDLSDNNISNIGDLAKLLSLKTLLLHGNSITTLRMVPAHLPVHLSILSLAENEIRDLNEVSYLAPLHELEQLSVMSNPCVMATPSLPGFDYRPYILSWCLSLKVLDGYVVEQTESLKAEWLYSQGKGRSYRPGQHVQLVQYLANVCPLTKTPALATAESAKLEKILNKQRFHQRQLLQQTHGDCSSPPCPSQLHVETQSPHRMFPEGGASETITSAASATIPPSGENEPTVQFNTWVNCYPAQLFAPVIRSPRGEEESIYLEDVQTDEEKLNNSMLSSESTFLPVSSGAEPQPARSDSEDETETFDPDSLAPERPVQPKKPHTLQIPRPHSENTLKQDTAEDVKSREGYNSTASVPATCPFVDKRDLPQATSPDVGKVELDEEASGDHASGQSKAEKAAVRIQAWWRGLYTCHCHPMAKEVRSEIRLRRMQDHILFLTGESERMQKLYEEEKLQRLVQEDAVKFMWKQLLSMQQWQQVVEQQLASVTHTVSPAQPAAAGPCGGPARLPVASSPASPPQACTRLSFPDSGFQSTSEPHGGDSFLSSDTAGSLETTVRALALPVGGNSPDCSLLGQYLSSVEQREVEEEEEEEEEEVVVVVVVAGDRTETPQLTSPMCPSGSTRPDSALKNWGGMEEERPE